MAAKKKVKSKKSPAPQGPVLVAVDFSEDSRAALVWALETAPLLKAQVRILHVVHDPAEAPGYYKKDHKDLARPMEDIAAKMLKKFIRKTCKDSNVKMPRNLKTRLVKGLPVTRIIEVAQKIGAHMIVMGSQGRTGLSHLLIGSKAEQVVQLSPIPVTIVKTGRK